MKGSHEWGSGRRSRRGSEKGVLKRVSWGFRKGVPDSFGKEPGIGVPKGGPERGVPKGAL